MQKIHWIAIVIFLSLYTACESPIYTLHILTNNTSELKVGDEVELDGEIVGKVGQVEIIMGQSNYQMIRLDLKIPVNLPEASTFDFPNSRNEKDEATLLIKLKASDKIYLPGDTINLLKKGFDKQITAEPVAIPSDNITEIAKPEPVEKTHTEPSLVYCIQIKTLRTELTSDDKLFNGLKPITVVQEGATYKYYFGDVPTLSAARDLRIKAVEKGFADAFIAAFLDGSRISIGEALKFEN